MYDKVAWKLVLIVLVIGACVYFAYPPKDKLILAPDLAGGTLLELSVADPNARDSVVKVLKIRQDNTGMRGLEIVPVGNRGIQIIAPSGNSDDVTDILKQAVLEFKAEAPAAAKEKYAEQIKDVDISKGLPKPNDPNYTVYKLPEDTRDGRGWVLVESVAKFKGSNFAGFRATDDSDGKPAVGFKLEATQRRNSAI